MHAPASEFSDEQSSAKNNGLQQDTAAQVDAGALENAADETTSPQPGDYTISVEQVREHLKQKGLRKSKDTIQRWCRAGDLDCRKQGLLNRFFTTEASLKALEEKLLPDMIADQVGNIQSHEAAKSEMKNRSQLHADAMKPAFTDMQVDAAEDADARTDMQPDATPNAPAQSSIQMNKTAEVAELRAQVEGLTNQLEQAQQISKFLQEEIVSARGQRGDVVKIAEQMLGTLETMAVGGRLEKQTRNQPQSENEPVRYQPVQADQSAV